MMGFLLKLIFSSDSLYITDNNKCLEMSRHTFARETMPAMGLNPDPLKAVRIFPVAAQQKLHVQCSIIKYSIK